MSLAFLHSRDCSEAHSDAVWGIAWTSTDTVVSISADGSIQQWSSSSGQPHPGETPSPHTLALVSLSVSPDGKYALYNSIEGLTSLWELETGKIVGKYESYVRTGEESEPSWSVSLNPVNETTYASSGGTGNIIIHSAQSHNFGENLAQIPSGRNKFGMYCSYSPDSRRIAMSNEAGQIFVFDLESNSLSQTFQSHAMAVRSLSWSSDGNLLLSASEDKRLGLYDVRTVAGNSVATLQGHSSWVLSCDLSLDSRLALSGSADKTIKVWDIGTRAVVSSIQDTGEVWSVAWRPKPPVAGSGGAGAFVTGGEDGIVRWWRGAGGGP